MGTSTHKAFPQLAPGTWRTDCSYVITLVDGARLPAYPVHGAIRDNGFYFGEACQSPMWYILDRWIDHSLIQNVSGARIVDACQVADWEELSPIQAKGLANE